MFVLREVAIASMPSSEIQLPQRERVVSLGDKLAESSDAIAVHPSGRIRQ